MKKYFIYIVCLFNGLAYAQIQQGESTVNRDTDIKDESVVVERVYEPKVEAAEKIKQTPKIESAKKSKMPVVYGLKDVEAESDFETSTINADEIPLRNNNLYNNYVRGGFGNRNTFLADGYAAFNLDNNKMAGLALDYYTSAADVRNTITDSDELKMNAEGFLKMNFDNAAADLRLGGFLHQLNYYGIDSNLRDFITVDNVEQSYKNIYIAGKYSTFNNIFLDNVKVKAGFFSDDFDASESTFDLSSTMQNEEIYQTNVLNDMNLGAKAEVNINLSNTDFDAVDDGTYRTFNAGITPQIVFTNSAFQLNLGANIQYLDTSTPHSLAGAEKSEFYFFPAADFSINAIPEFGVYGGVTGGFMHNRHQSLYNNNPYLFPYQELIPTKNKLEAYAGFRGDIGQNYKYDIAARFQKLENIPFYSRDNVFTNYKPYTHRNSFKTIYDDGEKTTIEGTINYTGLSNLDLGATLTLQSYKLDHMEEAWNEPSVKVTMNAHYKLLNDQLILGGDIFFVGERDATYNNLLNLDKSQMYLLPQKSLDSYVDLNLNATYMFLERWGAFLEIRNVLNQKYERYLDYEVQGTTGIGGVFFKF